MRKYLDYRLWIYKNEKMYDFCEVRRYFRT